MARIDTKLNVRSDLKAEPETPSPALKSVSPEFLRRLSGYGLTTAEILYRLPDHPKILQTYIWQDFDLAPNFPALKKFLNFWREKLDGPLHSVRVGHQGLIRPIELSTRNLELTLH